MYIQTFSWIYLYYWHTRQNIYKRTLTNLDCTECHGGAQTGVMTRRRSPEDHLVNQCWDLSFWSYTQEHFFVFFLKPVICYGSIESLLCVYYPMYDWGHLFVILCVTWIYVVVSGPYKISGFKKTRKSVPVHMFKKTGLTDWPKIILG
jgi:hypothetical protein